MKNVPLLSSIVNDILKRKKVQKTAILIVVFKTINLMCFTGLCEGKYVFYGLIRQNTLDAAFPILLNSGNQTLFLQ